MLILLLEIIQNRKPLSSDTITFKLSFASNEWKRMSKPWSKNSQTKRLLILWRSQAY
jgi:hypothetical protein